MSSSALRKTMIVVAVIGLGWATYLTYVHYSGANPVCSLKGDPCAAVQKSRYSELLGVPVALIGAIGYLLILGSLLLADDERATYREVFTLHKICEDCVASAVIMTVLACLSVWRFLRGDDLLPVDSTPNDATQVSGEAPEPAAPLGAAHS
jgi:uncharacterized membrane protein